MTAKSAKKPSSGTAKASKAAPRKSGAKTTRKPAAGAARAPKRPVRAASPKPAPAKTRPRPVPAASRKSKRKAARKEFEHFRKMLLDRQRELMQTYDLYKGDTRTGADSGTEDYIDYAVNSYAKEFLLSLTEMDRKQLMLVDDALRRIDRGEYGRCQQCGEEISRKRLEVAPWARYCVRCQELDEKGLLPESPAHVGAEDLEQEEGLEVAEPGDEGEAAAEEGEELEEDTTTLEEEPEDTETEEE